MNTFQKVNKLVIILSITVIPLVFAPIGKYTDYFYLPKVNTLFLLLSGYLLYILVRRKMAMSFIEKDRINYSLCIFLVLLIISIFFSGNAMMSIHGAPFREEGLSTIIMYMLLFIAARMQPKVDEKFFIYILGTALIVAFYGIIQFCGVDPFPRDFIRSTWQNISFSTMGNPNFLGSYLVLVLPISTYLYIFKGARSGLAAFSILFLCLLCTRTRGAWLGTIFSMVSFLGLHFIVYGLKQNQKGRYIILLIFTMSIVILFNVQTGGMLVERVATMSNDAKDILVNNNMADKAGSSRFFIWKRVVQMISHRPFFGYGIENLAPPFVKLYEKDMIDSLGYVLAIDKAHNEYLHIAVSSGIPSLMAYITFIILALKMGWMRLQKNEYVLPLLSSVLGYLVQAFFNISVVSVAYIFWVFLGLMVSNTHEGNQDKVNTLNEGV